ncbi:hypothetical protein IKF03_01940 [Candidatus Saccharibacteria bacterium]|nr:hypothetical protein [Candidatus Saccharibacteria bacterium]
MVTKKSKIIKLFSALSLLFVGFNNAFAVDGNTNFNVNVAESLFVSVSTPTDWASGYADAFLRNKVSVNVVSNNTNGFTASMTTKTDNTALVNNTNNTYTLPTLASTTSRANFPANFWGYSFDDTESGSDTSNYGALVGVNGTPITILSSSTASTGSKDFYFGAKANVTQASGTYTGTVVISVVSGVIDPGTNPITPVNPVTPNPTPNTPTYNSSSNVTSYTYNPTVPNTDTTVTIIDTGDTRGVYNGYTPPQGVTRTTSAKTQAFSTLATGLAVAATIATTSGMFLLFAARREEDDENE